MGFLLLVIVVGTVILIVGLAIGVSQHKKGQPLSHSEESPKDYEVELTASEAVPPVYEEVTLVDENNRIKLSYNIAYGHISHK